MCALINLIGFIIIGIWITRQGTKHYKAGKVAPTGMVSLSSFHIAHESIGLAIFIASILQPILGVVTERLIRKGKYWAANTLTESGF